jgi:hypothetical protein
VIVRGVAAFAIVMACAAVARAQPAPPPAEPPPPAAEEAEEDDAEDEPKPAKSPAVEPPAEPPAEPLPPPLPPPRPDEQELGPYVAPQESDAPERKLEIGPDFGITARSAEGDGVSYSPGFTWGAHLRVELVSFLGFRAYFNNSYHAVDVPTGALSADPPLSPDEVDQEDLKVTVIGARLEPTWVVTPELRLWAGLGVAWGRVFAEEPETTPEVASHDRTGVLLEWTGSLGGSYDVIPRWLAVTLLLSGGLVSNQSGDVFDRTQVISQTGQITYLGGLPEFTSTMSALVGLGIIL